MNDRLNMIFTMYSGWLYW